MAGANVACPLAAADEPEQHDRKAAQQRQYSLIGSDDAARCGRLHNIEHRQSLEVVMPAPDPQTPSLALAKERTAQETKPTFAMRLAKVFKRAKKPSIESYPITSAEKVLIANLMAMR